MVIPCIDNHFQIMAEILNKLLHLIHNKEINNKNIKEK